MTELFCCCSTFKLPTIVKSPPIETSPTTSKRLPIETSPVAPILIFSVPAVKNCNSSLSSPAPVSAVIYVSPSTSFTPPKEPQASPAPKPSNCSN